MGMNQHLVRRPLALLVTLGVALAAMLAALPAPAAAQPDTPDSIAALGDSITVGFHTAQIGRDNPENSWSTGTNPAVNSLYQRLLADNPAIAGKNYNYGITGAPMEALPLQAYELIAEHDDVELITILMGHNDACRPTIDQMTPVDVFRGQFVAALGLLTTNYPAAEIKVASLVDMYQLWELSHTKPIALRKWADPRAPACPSLLANPLSTADTDVQRRAAFRQQLIAYNGVLEAVCEAYPQCDFDENYVFNSRLRPEDVSTIDYFHPSVTGQARLAEGIAAAFGIGD